MTSISIVFKGEVERIQAKREIVQHGNFICIGELFGKKVYINKMGKFILLGEYEFTDLYGLEIEFLN